MLRTVATYAAILLFALPGFPRVGDAQGFRPASAGSPTDVVSFVEDVFFKTHSSGSLLVGGACGPANAATDVVSDYLPHAPAGPFHSIGKALTALSRVDPRVSWSRDADGLVRVRDGDVPEDVLRIRLRRVHFKNRAQSGFAIEDILSTPEVRAYFEKNHIERGAYARMGDLGMIPGSTKGLPRLSGTLRNVTVAEALDHVARFFHTLWIYSDCSAGPRRVVVIAAY